MPAGRTIAIAMTAVVLAVPGAALGQGAGDEQYSDPLAGGEDTEQPTTGSQDDGDGLSQTPDLGGSQVETPTTSGETTTPSPTTTTTTTSGQLPNTGSDPREIILAGLALFLAGFGLRLRTADEVF